MDFKNECRQIKNDALELFSLFSKGQLAIKFSSELGQRKWDKATE